MPYSTALPGIAESCLDTLKGIMIGKLSDLNAQLAARSAPLSSITVTGNQFYIGDPDTMPDATANPFWVSLVGGGKQDGRDTEIAIKQTGPGYWHTVYHNIYFYLHPQSLPGSDAFVQAEARERLRALVQDWLVNDVFNNGTNYTITLGSRQFATAPAYDTLNESYITDVSKGYVMKSFGGTQWIFMAHYVHRGRLYGGY